MKSFWLMKLELEGEQVPTSLLTHRGTTLHTYSHTVQAGRGVAVTTALPARDSDLPQVFIMLL